MKFNIWLRIIEESGELIQPLFDLYNCWFAESMREETQSLKFLIVGTVSQESRGKLSNNKFLVRQVGKERRLVSLYLFNSWFNLVERGRTLLFKFNCWFG